MSIPYTPWPDGALQGNVPVNDSLQALAALGQANVEQTLNAPPTTVLADAGKMWLIGTAPTGVWSGRSNSLALCTAANVWRFFAPGSNAWIVWDKGSSQVKRYDTTAAAWVVWNDQVYRGVKNYLINGDFAINQRAFAGGALAAGVYGHDRWKAGTGGCNYTVNATTAVITHTSGPIVQVIEAPRLASTQVTVSVEDPSGTITVNLDGQTGAITSGAGRRGVALTLPSGSTGNVTLTLTATGVTYKRVQVELGSTATPFEWRPIAVELPMCERYFQSSRSYASGAYWTGQVTNGSQYAGPRPFSSLMRAAPSVTLNGAAGVNVDVSSIGVIDADVAGFRFIATANATGAGTILAQFKADSEL